MNRPPPRHLLQLRRIGRTIRRRGNSIVGRAPAAAQRQDASLSPFHIARQGKWLGQPSYWAHRSDPNSYEPSASA